MLRRLLLTLLLPLTLMAAANDSINYVPKFHGVFRGRFEQSTVENVSRFQVRNARVSMSGAVARSIDYFIMADLCDRGKMKILDAWGRLSPTRSLSFQIGQFRMPFGIETFLAPQTYYFANRSYMGKTMCNYRAVGAKVSYTLPWMPLTIDAGAFNPNTISDHSDWHKPLAYSGRATFRPGDFTIEAGVMSIVPDSVRMNLADVAIKWQHSRWILAAEYMYEHYTGHAHKGAHSYVAQADYCMPIKAWEFNRLSFQGRFDGITDQSNGIANSEGRLTTTMPAAQRITLGSTISHIGPKGLHADLRLNYEKMFFDRSVKVTPDLGDKFVAELVIAF